MRKDWESIELCDRFFDAIEAGDYDTIESCYAPELVVWHSGDCLYESRESNLEHFKPGFSSHTKRRYKDRRVHPFEGGFVQQHTMELTHENGFVGRMKVCFIAYVRDGMLSRIYEYYDRGRLDEFLGPGTLEALEAREAAAGQA